MKFGKLKERFPHVAPLLLLVLVVQSSESQLYSPHSSQDRITNTNVQHDIGHPSNSFGALNSMAQTASITETPQAKNDVDSGVPSSSMYYYEMYPMMNKAPKRTKKHQRRYYPLPGESYYKRTSHDDGGYGGGGHGHGDQKGYGHEGGSVGGWGWEEEEEKDGGGGGLGGIVGALGLLGLKGIKGLKGLIPLAFILPFLPILIPIILLAVALPLLALILFLPIPVVVPPVGRSFTARGLEGYFPGAERALKIGRLLPELAANVLQSEECVERIACEIARVSKTVRMDKWVEGLSKSLPQDNDYVKKFMKGFHPTPSAVSPKTSDGPKDCSAYTCRPKSILDKAKQLDKVR